MDFPAQVRKSANLHIHDDRHGPICIFLIDVNALRSSIFILSARFFFMDYPDQVRKSTNLYIQDGRNGLISILKIDMNALQSSIFIRSSQLFF